MYNGAADILCGTIWCSVQYCNKGLFSNKSNTSRAEDVCNTASNGGYNFCMPLLEIRGIVGPNRSLGIPYCGFMHVGGCMEPYYRHLHNSRRFTVLDKYLLAASEWKHS